ncbi:catalase family peroxidase [Ectopseudomonas mendocina]|uniref:Catalase-related peroxidase n=1 Tax=Ectopseudomonas mendocina TaxID=300 RepID=A0ABZ2RNJ7_ECTME
MTQNQLYDALLDALYATFGRHPGFRVAHAKGVLVQGTFVASPEAKRLSRAPHFQGGVVPVVLRFSNFSGIPSTVDGDPTASPHGLAIRFTLPDGKTTDIVSHSFNGFPVATPEEFLSFLRGIAAAGGDQANPAQLGAFLSSHPRAKAFIEAAKPAPQSYASLEYYGVNAFVLVNQSNQRRAVRYRIEPLIREQSPDVREIEGWEPDHLRTELKRRLLKGPVKLRLIAQLAAPGDSVTDGSEPWPETNEEVNLGLFTLSTLIPEADQDRLQQALDFNPARLSDGIEDSGDPMIMARQRIYERAVARRSK